jgi:hypothetical protein
VRARRKLDMRPLKRLPVAVCTSCGAISYNVPSINQRCCEKIRGKRCDGIYGSRISNRDWKECRSCAGTGYNGYANCKGCDGVGWHAA